MSVPGTTVGGLTINNTLILQAGCSNIFEIDKDLGTNDTVRGLTSVTMAGTLWSCKMSARRLMRLATTSNSLPPAAIRAALRPSCPPRRPAGLIWLTNNLNVNGTLGVAVLPNPIPLKVFSASSLVSNEVNVIFSAELDPNTSQNPANYTVSTGQGVADCHLAQHHQCRADAGFASHQPRLHGQR